MTIPFEKYKEEIKISFVDYWKTLSSDKIDEYFETDEVKELIEKRYQLFMEPENILHGTGSISSVAYCLAMMY